MGWPDKTPDFEAFYPNSTLETGSDILFFWVARMVFMGYAITDKLPFDTVRFFLFHVKGFSPCYG
jgi:valyl-tRNA synthetase